VPHTILGSGDTAVSKINKKLALKELAFYLNNGHIREAGSLVSRT
jgi:hypothetical protein